MADQRRRFRPVLGLVSILFVSLAWAAMPARADAALPAWTGGINLYRTGVFSTQKSWLWCTAADVQIMRNMKYGRTDHSSSAQRRYFSYMRARNKYSLPLSAGVDPVGWTAGLRYFVDKRYRLMSSETLRTAGVRSKALPRFLIETSIRGSPVQCRVAAISSPRWYSRADLRMSVTRARPASSVETAKAATKLYSL